MTEYDVTTKIVHLEGDTRVEVPDNARHVSVEYEDSRALHGPSKIVTITYLEPLDEENTVLSDHKQP